MDPNETLIDFRNGNQNPTWITKPYGPAQPWPANRPATWITKAYGPAIGAPVRSPGATYMIPPPGCPSFSNLSVVPGDDFGYAWEPKYGGARPPGLGGFTEWTKEQIEAAKRYAVKYPWLMGIMWVGGVLIAWRLIGALKDK